ncbi:MAG: hypothetical protein JXA54_09740 [Candidatus Heimdallarchaeota archaeon]|nr:hypothetical protein [Candidatus Heimdallarchaeota archaeon]
MLFRIIGNLMQVIFNNPSQNKIASFSIYFALYATLFAITFVIFFISTITDDRKLKYILLYISLFFIGGSFLLALDSNSYVISYNLEQNSYVGKGGLVWIISIAATILIAGSLFLYHLLRQFAMVQKKHHKALVFMVLGNFLYAYVTIFVYSLRSMVVCRESTLHLENLFFSTGILLMVIGIIISGKTALFGSSEIYFINIYSISGLSLYHGTFGSEEIIDEQLISGISTAISTFFMSLRGEEIIPNEIKLDDYSFILAHNGNCVGFINCRYPSRHLKEGLRNIMNNFNESLSKKEISKLIDKFLPYGEPMEYK